MIKKFRLPVLLLVMCFTTIAIIALINEVIEVTTGCVAAMAVLSTKLIESDEKTTNGE